MHGARQYQTYGEASDDSGSETSVSSTGNSVDFCNYLFLKRTRHWHRENLLLRRLYPDNTEPKCALTFSLVVLKYATPALLAGLCLFISMFLMHWGTHVYVQQMLEFEAKYVLRSSTVHRQRADGMNFSFETGFNGSSIGSLEDPLTTFLGYEHYELASLDQMALLFPVAFVLLSLLVDDVGCWTRIMACHALLALGKGIMSCLTVVPDSAGWAACKDRLQEDGVEWMQQTRSLGEIFMLEINGLEGRQLRWCADMMYSGHTYFVTLYALGVHELVRNSVLFMASWKKRTILFFVAAAGLMQQIFEVKCVLKNHFHYTSDVVMAVVMTFLIYTNSSLAVGARRWVEFLVTWPNWLDPDADEENPKAVPRTYYFNQSREPALKNSTDEEHTMRPWVWSFDTTGEIFVPICCCMCTGQCQNVRRYVFNEEDIVNLMATIRCGQPLEDEDILIIQKRMRMHTTVNPAEVAVRSRQVAASFKERAGYQLW